MNEQLQAALAEIISRAVSGIDASTKFLSEQLPDVVQQLLMWKFWYHLLTMLAPVVIFAIVLASLRLTIRSVKAEQVRKQAITRARDTVHKARYGKDQEAFDSARRNLDALEEIPSPIDSPLFVAGCFFQAIAGFLSITFMMFSFNLTWLQILIAPKIYLIEYAAQLAGGK